MMTHADIIANRLANQQLGGDRFRQPAEIVQWLGAMQAQEYAMAKWAIGLRIPGIKETEVEKAFNEGAILRTHILRPTWHFVAPADIRWIQALTARRVHAFNAYYYRQQELDAAVFRRSNKALVNALEGGKHLTRTALQAALKQAKIQAAGVRLACIIMYAELECLICSGPRQGKQFTYALLDERTPPAPALDKEEALAALALRYFSSRSPATVQDFAWWSGLPVSEARTAAALLPPHFERVAVNGQEYLFTPAALPPKRAQLSTFLMPDYDEYAISYKDRSAILNGQSPESIYYHMLVVDGRMAGAWRKSAGKGATTVEITPFAPLNKTKQQAVAAAIKRYQSFAGLPPAKK